MKYKCNKTLLTKLQLTALKIQQITLIKQQTILIKTTNNLKLIQTTRDLYYLENNICEVSIIFIKN